MSLRDRDFPLKLSVSLSDKILHLQLILALISTAYTHLIVKFVIQQTKFAYIMQSSYHLAIVYLWCNVHNPKEDEMWQNTEESIPKHVT